MHKVLQKPLQSAIFSCLKLQNPLSVLPSVLLQHEPNLGTARQSRSAYNSKTEVDVFSVATSLLKEKTPSYDAFHVFRSFSLGLFLNPDFSPVLPQIRLEKAEKLDLDESQIMWADSVKKKRKKKMNKHKLRKLRKRLRGYA